VNFMLHCGVMLGSRASTIGQRCARGSLRPLFCCLAVILLASQVVAGAGAAAAPPEPVTARDFFNAGTKLLEEAKLKEAERMLDTALGFQVEALQSPTLYNLGHVRYKMGLEILKKGPAPKPTATAAAGALKNAEDATRQAEAALNTTELQRLITAYVNGRGARKGLNAAIAAVRKAMETYGNVLGKWQRASGDFKSALELNPKDAEARHNTEVVDRSIAALVDSLREMQAMAEAMGQMKKELGEKMKQLKGRIPEENMPPGAAGEDEEEEEPPPQGEKGKEEGPSREGQEMSLSPEQAGWLLDAFRLDKDRKLPMGEGTRETEPNQRNRPTW